MPGSIQDARKVDLMLVLQEVTIQQARYNVRIPIIAVITKWCGCTEKEALGSASERREKLTVGVKFEFSDGLMVFKVEEITSSNTTTQN